MVLQLAVLICFRNRIFNFAFGLSPGFVKVRLGIQTFTKKVKKIKAKFKIPHLKQIQHCVLKNHKENWGYTFKNEKEDRNRYNFGEECTCFGEFLQTETKNTTFFNMYVFSLFPRVTLIPYLSIARRGEKFGRKIWGKKFNCT